MYAIGIDIGGTSVKAGLCKDGKIVCSNRKPTAPTPEQVSDNIVIQIKELLKNNSLSLKDVKGVGIGCPGLISSDEGLVYRNSNMKWDKFPIVSYLKRQLDTEIKVSNDANVAALGETLYGAAAHYKNAIMLTLGTGVGGGVIIDNKIYEGGFSKGAELGHTVIVKGGVPCGCGRRGCFEQYASATALIRMTKAAMNKHPESAMWQFAEGKLDKVDGRTAFECSKSGDRTAKSVVNKYVSYLADGIMNFSNIFRPEVFIIGGGISAQGAYLTDKIKARCEKFWFGYKHAPQSEIVAASLGNDAGIIGAAALVL